MSTTTPAPTTSPGAAAMDTEAGTEPAKAAVTKVQPVFSEDLLRLYYARLFPYEQMFKWLSYGHDPASDSPLVQKDFLSKREFSFTMKDDIYIRYLSFRDEEQMRTEIQKRQPHKIDIGAVFTHQPDKHTTIKASQFHPVERELVFDIDATDYDLKSDTIWSSDGKSMSNRIWPFMAAVVKVLEVALREDFGFKDLLFVYSGRRGVHCWVCDPEARALTNEARSALADYLALEVTEGSKKVAGLTGVMHPSLSRAFETLEPLFVPAVASEEGQGLLCSAEGWNTLLDMVPDAGVRSVLSKKWAREAAGAETTAAQKWEEMKGAVQAKLQKAPKRARVSSSDDGGDKDAGSLRYCIESIVFYYLYPRLDINVSKARNHLLKSPFVVHPKTGRVCVPFDPRTADTFDCESVCCLGSLVQEIDDFDAAHPDEKERAIPDWKKTSMKGPIEFFERSFLRPMHAGIRAAFSEQREKAAATTNDW